MFSHYGVGDVVLDYCRWHYGRGLRELLDNIKNFIALIFHFFSIKLLLKTLFHPLKRLQENYSSKFDPGSFFSALLVNTIMRLVGMVVRLGLIIVGLLLFVFSLPVFLALILAWVAAPLILLALLTAAFSLIFLPHYY